VVPVFALLLGLTLAAPAAPSADTSAAPEPFTLRETLVFAGAGGDSAVGEPAGIAVDAFGHVWVSDAALHRVARFDSAGVWRGAAGTLGSGDGELRRPGALAPLGTLSVAVLDRENRRVQAIDLFGRWLGTRVDLAATTLADELGRIDAIDLAADRGGALFVADRDRDRVLVFDAHGRYQAALGGFGPRPGSFRGLAGVALAPRGELVTTERTGARVQRLDAGGRALASWPLDVRPGGAALPVAVDEGDRVAVADEASGRLWVFDADGRPLAVGAGLAAPRALAFAPGGALLVAESRGRVRRFVLEPRARDQ
jgi:DNA-binding beta-propeller fold protein YncE